MPREVDCFGILFPTLVPILIVSGLLYAALDIALARLGVYRRVWHVDLFRVALFAILFSVLGNWVYA